MHPGAFQEADVLAIDMREGGVACAAGVAPVGGPARDGAARRRVDGAGTTGQAECESGDCGTSKERQGARSLG